MRFSLLFLIISGAWGYCCDPSSVTVPMTPVTPGPLRDLVFMISEDNQASFNIETIFNRTGLEYGGLTGMGALPFSETAQESQSLSDLDGVYIRGDLLFKPAQLIVNNSVGCIEVQNISDGTRIPQNIGDSGDPYLYCDLEGSFRITGGNDSSWIIVATAYQVYILDVSTTGKLSNPRNLGTRLNSYVRSITAEGNTIIVMNVYAFYLFVMKADRTFERKLYTGIYGPQSLLVNGTLHLLTWSGRAYTISLSSGCFYDAGSCTTNIIGYYGDSIVYFHQLVYQNDSQKLLVLTSGNSGTTIVNITDPVNPQRVFFNSKYRATSLHVSAFIYDHYLTFVALDFGLILFDMRSFTEVRRYTSFVSPLGIIRYGNMIALYSATITYIDVSKLNLHCSPHTSHRGIYSASVLADANLALPVTRERLMRNFTVTVTERIRVTSPVADVVLGVSRIGSQFQMALTPSARFQCLGIGCIVSLQSAANSTAPKWLSGTYVLATATNYDEPHSGATSPGVQFEDILVIVLRLSVKIFLLTDPTDPQLVARIDFVPWGLSKQATFVDRTKILVVTDDCQIISFDISVLSQPRLIGRVPPITPSWYANCRSVTILPDPTKAWVTGYGSAMIVNITDVSQISVMNITQYPHSNMVPMPYRDVLATCESSAVSLYSNTNMSLISSVPFSFVTACSRRGAVIYTTYMDASFPTNDQNRLSLIDITNPLSPIILLDESLKLPDTSFIALSIIVGHTLVVAESQSKKLYMYETRGGKIVNFNAFPLQFVPYSLLAADNLASITVLGVNSFIVIDVGKTIFELKGVPTAADAGNYHMNLTAMNDLGEKAFALFSIRVDGPPKVLNPIPPRVAFVGETFNALVSQGVFVDPNQDVLSFSATLQSGASLPRWLQFSPTGIFFGIPSTLDVGRIMIRVTADDGHEGSSFTDFEMVVSHAPLLQQNIATQVLQVGAIFSFSVQASTFIDVDGDPIVLSAALGNGLPLPSWIAFDASTRVFSGKISTVVRLNIMVTATEIHGGKASTVFDALFQHAPVATSTLRNPVVGYGMQFSYSAPPNLFFDEDGDAMTFRAVLNSTLTDLPSWLTFVPASLTFSGVGPASGLSSQTIIPVRIIAEDAPGAQSYSEFSLIFDFFPTVQNGLQPVLVQVGLSWNFTLPHDMFFDADDPGLRLSCSMIGAPAWLIFSNATATFSGVPSARGTFDIAVTATDTKGGSVTSSIHIISDIFPSVDPKLKKLPVAIAPIGAAFSLRLPSGMFWSDAQGTGLTLSAHQLVEMASPVRFRASSAVVLRPLPSWMIFDPAKQLFSGVPTLTDGGVLSIHIQATDAVGGSASARMDVIATFIPEVVEPMKDFTARPERHFSGLISNSTFRNRSLRPLSYRVEAPDDTRIPAWLSFNPANMSVSGTPRSSDLGDVVNLLLIANDGLAETSAQFSVAVVANQPPVLVNRMIDQSTTVLHNFVFSLPIGMFSDPDGDQLTLNVSLSDGRPLPYWIKFSSSDNSFRGRAGRNATNPLSPRDYFIMITALDGQSQTTSSFTVRLGGDSWLAWGLKLGSYLLSVISFLLAVYNKRDMIWRYIGKSRYMVPPLEIPVDTEFTYSFSRRTVSCKVALPNGKEVPINDFFEDIRFVVDGAKLHGIPRDIAEHSIVAYNDWDVLSRAFKLVVLPPKPFTEPPDLPRPEQVSQQLGPTPTTPKTIPALPTLVLGPAGLPPAQTFPVPGPLVRPRGMSISKTRSKQLAPPPLIRALADHRLSQLAPPPTGPVAVKTDEPAQVRELPPLPFKIEPDHWA